MRPKPAFLDSAASPAVESYRAFTSVSERLTLTMVNGVETLSAHRT